MNAHNDALDQILETDFWPASIPAGHQDSRIADDSDGNALHRLDVIVGGHGIDYGDVYLVMPQSGHSLRFRTELGGGASPRVRNALLVLAEAMRRDNEARPQNRDTGARKEPTPDMEVEVCLEVLKRLSTGTCLDSEIAARSNLEQQAEIKRAIQATAMDVYEKTWNDFLSR